jgi:hypothetical protein
MFIATESTSLCSEKTSKINQYLAFLFLLKPPASTNNRLFFVGLNFITIAAPVGHGNFEIYLQY